MPTQNAVNTTLSGQTATGLFVGSTSPVLTTPTIGVATATTLAFTSNTSGLIGTPTGANPSVGIVGEVKSFSIQFPDRIALTSNVVTNLGNVELTAGDWDCEGNIFFLADSGVITVHTTAFSQTSATFPNNSFASLLTTNATPGISATGVTIPVIRVSVNATVGVFAVVRAVFSVGNGTVCGNIFARRAR